MTTHHRGWITVSVMLATIMQALDGTIANVALPYIQGAMSTTQEQIAWVLTSYLVSAAIFMPLTGFIAARFGRKRVFIVAVVGFTIASVCCGAAQNLEQLILFRFVQGAFGASLVPLSQAVLLDTFPAAQQSKAMAMWGVGIMVGPILGPTLGSYLTEYYHWRWIFYINLIFGGIAWYGLARFIPETTLDLERRFDWLGFFFLSISLGSLQLVLDRGHTLNWFDSTEIILTALGAGLFSYLFLVHILTSPHPFLRPALFKDRNFVLGLSLIFSVGFCLLATLALLPPLLKDLLNYPLLDVGYVLAPRGVGTMIGMLVVGRLANRVDPRYLIFCGLLLTSLALWQMMHFQLETAPWEIARTGVIQGLGVGFAFVPLTTIAFATLPPLYRNEGTSLFSLFRNLGSSVGIALMVSKFATRSQANHAVFSEYLTPFQLQTLDPNLQTWWNDTSTAGLLLLDAEVNRQAAMLAYLQDFRWMLGMTLIVMPLLLLIRPKPRPEGVVTVAHPPR